MELDAIQTVEPEEVTVARIETREAGWFFLTLMFLELPLGFAMIFIQGMFPKVSSALVSVLVTQSYLLLGALLYILIGRKSFVTDLGLRRYKVSSFFLSIVLLIVASPMATLLNLASQLFAKNDTSVAIYEITNNLPMGLGIAVIGCMPGFIEETLYRGILYQAFRKRSVLTGVLVSSVSFGLMHMNLNQVPYAIYLGLLFALLVEATGSIASTMILHMIFNAVNTAYVYVLPKLFEFLGKFSSEYAEFDVETALNTGATKSQILLSMTFWAPLAVGGLVLAILLLNAIAKINGRDISRERLTGDERVKALVKAVPLPLAVGWLFCIVVAVFEAVMG